jgi:hypothetical protein
VKLEVGSSKWKLEVRRKLEVGSSEWKLEVGSWKSGGAEV